MEPFGYNRKRRISSQRASHTRREREREKTRKGEKLCLSRDEYNRKSSRSREVGDQINRWRVLLSRTPQLGTRSTRLPSSRLPPPFEKKKVKTQSARPRSCHPRFIFLYPKKSYLKERTSLFTQDQLCVDNRCYSLSIIIHSILLFFFSVMGPAEEHSGASAAAVDEEERVIMSLDVPDRSFSLSRPRSILSITKKTGAASGPMTAGLQCAWFLSPCIAHLRC